MADIAKLDAVLAYIEQHPEEWVQTSWGHRNACGTAGCIAYHVGRLDGAEIEWSDWSDGLGPYFSVARIGGRAPDEYARQSLGLTEDQADDLFAGSNTLDILKDMRDLLAEDADLSGLWGGPEEDED